MSSIVDYTHTLYYYNGEPFSFSDFFHSAEWKEYIIHGTGEIPLQEGINLLVRLATAKKLPIDVALFGGIICGDDDNAEITDLFSQWKERDRRNESKRCKLMDAFLAKNRFYPYILYPLFNQRYTSTEKAQQLYATMEVWNHPFMRREFFMLVFKYSKRLGDQISIVPNLNVVIKYDRKRRDPLYPAYVEAGNALWAYIDHLNGKVEIVGRREKKREGSIFNAFDLEQEWVEWMGGQRGNPYLNLLNYHRLVREKQRERARFTVLMEFLWLYLNGDVLVDDPIPTRAGKPREQHLKIQRVHE